MRLFVPVWQKGMQGHLERLVFLILHTGPGVAAALPLLYNAQLGGVPLVVTAGQNDTRLLQYDPHLSGDIVGMGKIYTKWCTEIVHAEDIPTTIQRGFKMAMQPPTGPVLVSIPQNVLEQPFDFSIVASQANKRTYLIMHAIGPNLAGVLGTAVAGGIMLTLLRVIK
jgi:thiamine pyrophosphate-dependent acetolactate synthase large subunit-like protein